MNFLAPAGFLFAGAILVVVLFYLLKRKRVVRLVSSTVLWQRFLAETQASAPFQRLRKNWLMFLQILLLCLGVLALARPYFAGNAKPASLRVIVLDGSASMQATDEKPTRFDRARQEALSWVDSLSGRERMIILFAGAQTRVVQSATSVKADLRRALQSCVCSDSSTRLGPALLMAESLIRNQPGAEVHLFSDGVAGELNELENKGLPLIYHRVGKSGDNVGITALDTRANPDDPRQRAVFVGVVNYFSNPQPVEVELRLDQRPIETRVVTVPALDHASEVFTLNQEKDGIFTVRLKVNDELPTDNEASIPSLLPKPAKVLLVSAGNRFLEKALRAVPSLQLTVQPMLNERAAEYDFVVLDGVAPLKWPAANVLAFHVAKSNWFASVQSLEAPPIVDWKFAHPLLRYAGFETVQVVRSLGVKPPPWSTALVESPQAALMVAGETGGQRVIWVGFDPLESNWPLRVSFPVFIANAAEWLNPVNARNERLVIKPGDAFRLTLAEPVAQASVRLPVGQTRPVEVNPSNSEFVFGETAQQGVYRARFGTNEVSFCVDLLDANESNIRPRDELRIGKYTRIAATASRTNREIWRPLALGALALLLVEWWYYHRRSA